MGLAKPHVTRADIERIHARYLAGESIEVMGREIGFSGRNLRRRFQKYGLRLVSQQQRTLMQVQHAKENCQQKGREGCRPKNSQDDVIAKCRALYGDVCDYSETQYRGSTVPLTIICRKHQERFEQLLSNHLRYGSGCRSCFREKMSVQNRKHLDCFVQEARQIHGEHFDYTKVRYVNSSTPIEIMCRQHGVTFRQRPADHLCGKNGCPACRCERPPPKRYKTSRGEKRIRAWLDAQQIRYEVQKKFPTCRRVLPLPFDFFLPDHGFLIEYDGEGHFKPIAWTRNMTEQEATLIHNNAARHDDLKNEWAERNGYKLLRIRFDDDIELMLAAVFLEVAV